jgi:hypothetical protein
VPGIERANQKLMTWLTKYAKRTGKSAQASLPKVLELMNEVVPTQPTRMTPDDVENLPKADAKALAERITTKARARSDLKHGPDDAEVGNLVRLKRTNKYKPGIGKKNKFFRENWSEEVYRIAKVIRPKQPTKVITYKVADQPPSLKFTRHDIQKVENVEESSKVRRDAFLKAFAEAEALAEYEAKQPPPPPKEAPEPKPRKYMYDTGDTFEKKGLFFKGTGGKAEWAKQPDRTFAGTIKWKGTRDIKVRGKLYPKVESYGVIWDDDTEFVITYPKVDIEAKAKEPKATKATKTPKSSPRRRSTRNKK